MSLVLLLGGARSGKSQLAVEFAQESQDPVVFVATGQAGDEEMRARIERHRAERPSSWTTVEEPLALAAAIRAVDDSAFVIVDCLSLWLSNRLEDASDEEIRAEALDAAAAASVRAGRTLAVSNEVGLGLVPMHPLGRRYRDLLGEVNAAWATRAERALFVAAGRVLELEPRPSLRELQL